MQGNAVICPRGASRYAWKEGDTLASVALRFSTTIQALRLVNDATALAAPKAGDVICIPPSQLTCLSGALYTVRSGDTLTSIAETYGISTLELIERNPYIDPDDLVIGQIICVPSENGEADNDYCPEGYTYGVVRYGQTYASILIENDISYRAFRLSNPRITPCALTPGQRYCLPPADARVACGAGGTSYTLISGDTLSSVADKYNVSEGRLLRLNPLLAPSDFVPGRTICVSEDATDRCSL